jgi:hypothetical protein
MPRFPSSSCVNRNMPGSRGRGDVAHALSALFGARHHYEGGYRHARWIDHFLGRRELRRDCYHGLVLGRVYQWDSSVSVASTCATRGATSAGDALGPVGFPAALHAVNAAGASGNTRDRRRGRACGSFVNRYLHRRSGLNPQTSILQKIVWFSEATWLGSPARSIYHVEPDETRCDPPTPRPECATRFVNTDY